MLKHAGIILFFIGSTVVPAAAQGRGNTGRVPPGHLPPPGECRVWYDGVPPGQQPPPTSCREAERIASRARDARVIYGSDARYERDDRYGRDDRYERDDRYGRDGRYGRDERYERDDREGRRPRGSSAPSGRAVPRTGEYPDVYRSPDARYPSRRPSDAAAYRRGYDDGMVKGREDARDGDRFDPARHSWYRSANRGYDNRYGSREQYAQDYRTGFLDGYHAVHRDSRDNSRSRWWPF